MLLQLRKDPNLLVGNLTFGVREAFHSLYSNAWPFNLQKNPFVSLVGKNPALSTLADVWGQNIVRTLPTVGFTIGISSTSASDAAAGVGARTVEIDGVLANSFAARTVTLTLNGQTKVVDTSGLSFIRINGIRVITSGTSLTNVGVIYAFDSTDTVTAGVPQTTAKIFGYAAIGSNNSEQAMYTVPAGYNAQINSISVGIQDASATARAGNIILSYGENNIVVPHSIGGQIYSGLPLEVEPDFPWRVGEKQDIRI